MKRHRVDLTKYCIKLGETNNREVLLSHFDSKSFTLLAFDNFKHADRTILTHQGSAHDTTITLS